MNLDCARMYNSPRLIKKYILAIQRGHGNYIQLHLTDNQRFGIENETIGQTLQNAYKKGDIYYNKDTHKAFLSKQQLVDIVRYGMRHHVEVVPEIDVPGHSKAMLKLLAQTPKYKKEIKSLMSFDDEMYYQKPATLKIAKQIIGEYTSLVPKGNYISTGGDEIAINTHKDDLAIVKFDNALNRFLNQRGLKMAIWNDSIRKAVLNQYDKNILINFWSLSGQTADTEDYNANIKYRATLPEINKAGLKTINCNDYFTYIIADPTSYGKHNMQEWEDDLKKWKPTMWNEDSYKDKTTSKNNIGTSISIWGESPKAYNAKQVYQKTIVYVNKFFKHLHTVKYI
ncbi:family 20 glycosylhydrolase [Nicoliella lavandulae]|uniref:Family 20 glycosylhydrolase n=1 Tax=Nicoliella lavandulae TaxID=3082954 RepID=A0ABU8SLG5_9LACO